MFLAGVHAKVHTFSVFYVVEKVDFYIMHFMFMTDNFYQIIVLRLIIFIPTQHFYTCETIKQRGNITQVKFARFSLCKLLLHNFPSHVPRVNTKIVEIANSNRRQIRIEESSPNNNSGPMLWLLQINNSAIYPYY